MQSENKNTVPKLGNVTEKIKCECGQFISARNIQTHKKGQRHINHMKKQEETEIMSTLMTLSKKFDQLVSKLSTQPNLVHTADKFGNTTPKMNSLWEDDRTASHKSIQKYSEASTEFNKNKTPQILGLDVNNMDAFLDYKLRKLGKMQHENEKLTREQSDYEKMHISQVKQIILGLPVEKQNEFRIEINNWENLIGHLM